MTQHIIAELVEKTDFRDQKEVDEEVRQKMSSGSLFPTYTTGPGEDIAVKSQVLRQAMQIVTDEHFPNSNWLYDTPGLINEDQVCKTENVASYIKNYSAIIILLFARKYSEK